MESKNTTCENSIEKRLVTEVERVGGWCLKLPAIHNAGLPDRLCLFPGGEVVFVELKAFGKKPRKIQDINAPETESNGLSGRGDRHDHGL